VNICCHLYHPVERMQDFSDERSTKLDFPHVYPELYPAYINNRLQYNRSKREVSKRDRPYLEIKARSIIQDTLVDKNIPLDHNDCHKLHSAISSPILRRFPRSQSKLKALQKTFRSIPVTSRSDQYWPRY